MKHIIFLFITFLVCLVSLLHADDYTWIDPNGGELGDGTKWDVGVSPGADDFVWFTLPDSYDVWMDDSYTYDRMMVDGSDVTLDLNGFTLFLDGMADYNCSTIIGDEAFGGLSVSGGEIHSGDVFLGRNSNLSEGRLNLSGPETIWTCLINDGWHGFFAATGGDASVRVTDDAQLRHGHGQSGIYGKATYEIDGRESEWYVDGQFQMSVYGDTFVTLSNGARLRIAKLETALFPGSTATLNVTGVSHETELAIENWWDEIPFYLGRGGKAEVNLTGSKLFCSGNMVIGEEGSGRGQLTLQSGSWADIAGTLAVGGSLDRPGGEGLLYLYSDWGTGQYSDFSCAWEPGDSLRVWPKGTVRVDGGQIRLETPYGPNAIELRGGTLEGWGWIWADILNEGMVIPGGVGDWKVLNVQYDYTQGETGTLRIPIAGAGSNWYYGTLSVNDPPYGQVTLDGMLEVELWNGFVPAYEDEFVIIEAISLSGQFINAATEYVFEDGTFEVIYEPTRVILTHYVSEPRCPAFPMADLNKDCKVNLADFSVMAEQWLDCGLQPTASCSQQ
jgi:hypothetical protein